MKTNFESKDCYAVVHKGKLIDLHNNFDFTGLTDDPDNNEITLKFAKADGDWVKEGEFSRLTFVLKNVSYRFFEDGELGDFPNEAECLGEITFFPMDMRDCNDSIIMQRKPKDNDDLMFFFENGRVVRVKCKEAELIAEE